MIQGNSSGLESMSSYMQNMTSSGDIDGALGSTAVVFKVAVFIVMVIGGLALAIWTVRIGADILSLALPKSKLTDKIAVLGTGKAENYDNVMDYIKNNAVNTILMLTLIVFLVTGWIFQIAAMVMAGFGLLINKIVGIDVEQSIAEFDSQNYDAKASLMRPNQLKQEYDENVAGMRSQAQLIHEAAGGNPDPKDPKIQQYLRQYALYYARAHISSGKLNERDFNLEARYFDTHRTSGGSGPCNAQFLKNSAISSLLSAHGAPTSCNSSR